MPGKRHGEKHGCVPFSPFCLFARRRLNSLNIESLLPVRIRPDVSRGRVDVRASHSLCGRERLAAREMVRVVLPPQVEREGESARCEDAQSDHDATVAGGTAAAAQRLRRGGSSGSGRSRSGWGRCCCSCWGVRCCISAVCGRAADPSLRGSARPTNAAAASGCSEDAHGCSK